MNEILLEITAWDIANSLAVIAQMLFWMALLAVVLGQAPSVIGMLMVTRQGVKVAEILFKAWHYRQQKREILACMRRAVLELLIVSQTR